MFLWHISIHSALGGSCAQYSHSKRYLSMKVLFLPVNLVFLVYSMLKLLVIERLNEKSLPRFHVICTTSTCCLLNLMEELTAMPIARLTLKTNGDS
jgi:hypothetical protein